MLSNCVCRVCRYGRFASLHLRPLSVSASGCTHSVSKSFSPAAVRVHRRDQSDKPFLLDSTPARAQDLNNLAGKSPRQSPRFAAASPCNVIADRRAPCVIGVVKTAKLCSSLGPLVNKIGKRRCRPGSAGMLLFFRDEGMQAIARARDDHVDIFVKRRHSLSNGGRCAECTDPSAGEVTAPPTHPASLSVHRMLL